MPEPTDSPPKDTHPKADAAASKTQYRALLRGLYDAVIVVNETGSIVDCNVRAQKFLQCDEKSLLDGTIVQVVAGFTVEMLSSIRQDLDAGRFTVVHGYCMRVDGSNFPAEIAIGRITTEDRDDLVFSIRNISIRKAMEEELRTEHNALQNAVSSIAITDVSGSITYANPALSKLTGVTVAAMTGHHIRDFWVESPEAEQMVMLPAGGASWSGELTGRPELRDPPVRAHAMAAANRNADGQQIGMVFSFVDVTRLRQAEETLQEEAQAQMESARMSDAFAGRLSLLSLTDVIQLIYSTEKTGMLTISAPDGSQLSQIGFDEGAIVSATCGEKAGEPAITDAMRQGGHAFSFDPGKAPEHDPKVVKGTMTLLMEAAQEMDEND